MPPRLPAQCHRPDTFQAADAGVATSAQPQGQVVQAALPQAQVHAFDDAGHYVLEDKHEVLVPRLRDFLDRNLL